MSTDTQADASSSPPRRAALSSLSRPTILSAPQSVVVQPTIYIFCWPKTKHFLELILIILVLRSVYSFHCISFLLSFVLKETAN